jgi:hypothetical protein
MDPQATLGWLALVNSIFGSSDSSTTRCVPAYDAAGFQAIRKLVCDSGPLAADDVWEAHRELAVREGPGVPFPHAVREGEAAMRDPISGRVMIAWPPSIDKSQAERAIETLVDELNGLISAKFADETEL